MSSTSHSLAPKSPSWAGVSVLAGCSVVATVAWPSSRRIVGAIGLSAYADGPLPGMRYGRSVCYQTRALGDVAVHGDRRAEDRRDEGPQQQDDDPGPGAEQVHAIHRCGVTVGVEDRLGAAVGRKGPGLLDHR